MAVSAKAMLIGASLSRLGGVQPYHVKNLTKADPSAMWEAMFASGLPQPNTPHPEVPGIKVTDVRVSRMMGNFDAVVDVTYGAEQDSAGGASAEGEWEIDTSIVSVQTAFDYGTDGLADTIDIIYNPVNPANRAPGWVASYINGEYNQGAEVEQYLAMTTIRLTRSEDVNPGLLSLKYVGKLNDRDFAIQDDKEAWLCNRISGRRPLNTDQWINTYEFQSVEDGWHRIAVYIDPTTGKPPAKNMGIIKLSENRPRVRLPDNKTDQDKSKNGLTIVRVQGSADYTQLNLPPLDAQ